MIITIQLTYPSLQIVPFVCVCVCVCVVRTLKIYSLRKFHVYNTVLINYSRHAVQYSPRTYSSCNWKFVLRVQIFPFPLHTASGSHYSTLPFCEFDFFRWYVWVRLCSICLSASGLFHLACLLGSPMLLQMTGFPFYGWNNIPLCLSYLSKCLGDR